MKFLSVPRALHLADRLDRLKEIPKVARIKERLMKNDVKSLEKFLRKVELTAKKTINRDVILKSFDIMDNFAQGYLQDISKTICNFWETALLVSERLDKVQSISLSKAELENLKEIKERLYRVYSITTELYAGYFKINKSDKKVVDNSTF